MPTYALMNVSDETLLADLAALVATDRQTTAALLAHLSEVEARGLYLPAACTSMHAYCTRVLHLSEDAAYKRIRAARVARRFPALFDAIADGRLHLTAVVLISTHLTDENVDELITAATHRSKVEIEILVARLAPQPDVPVAIVPLTAAPGSMPLPQLVPEPVAAETAAPPPRVKPIAPDRFALQVTISQATRDKLERAKELLRHRNPSGDIAEVLERALDALLVTLEREKFGATSRSRAIKARREDADPRYVSNEVRRAVHARDGEQCTFMSADGVRCTERGFLELDHRTLVAHGGQPTVDNLRTLCRPHNQYEAEQVLGADFMQAKRARAAAAKAAPPKARSAKVSRATAPIEEATAPITEATAPITSTETEVALALRGLGFKSAEVASAMASTAQLPADTFEGRIRVALAELTRSRMFRCSDGPFDAVGGVGPRWACA